MAQKCLQEGTRYKPHDRRSWPKMAQAGPKMTQDGFGWARNCDLLDVNEDSLPRHERAACRHARAHAQLCAQARASKDQNDPKKVDPVSILACRDNATLVHEYTRTPVHAYTGTLAHRYLGTPVHAYTGTQMNRYTNLPTTPGRRNAGTQLIVFRSS